MKCHRELAFSCVWEKESFSIGFRTRKLDSKGAEITVKGLNNN
jgi:hypothetical protein